MLTGSGNITVNPLGVPSNLLVYNQSGHRIKYGKKCLSTIYRRNARINWCWSCSMNLEQSKIIREQWIIVADWWHFATLSFRLERKSSESKDYFTISNCLIKYSILRSALRLRLLFENGLPFKKINGVKNLLVIFILIFILAPGMN